MKLTATSTNDVREVFKEMRVRSGAPFVADESGYSMTVPDRLGSGGIRTLRLREGLDVFGDVIIWRRSYEEADIG